MERHVINPATAVTRARRRISWGTEKRKKKEGRERKKSRFFFANKDKRIAEIFTAKSNLNPCLIYASKNVQTFAREKQPIVFSFHTFPWKCIDNRFFLFFLFLVKRIIKYFGRRRVKRIIERLGYRMERREIDGKSIQDKRHLRERLSSIVGHRWTREEGKAEASRFHDRSPPNLSREEMSAYVVIILSLSLHGILYHSTIV